MATAYRYHSIEPEGLWTSEPFPAAERRHIVQGVIAGFLNGRPRWATALDGTFIYGLDAKGKEMKDAPSQRATGTPRHHATKKTPAQLQRDIDEALGNGRGQYPLLRGPGLWHDRARETREQIRGKRSHATIDRRKIRYVHLGWSNPPGYRQRFVEGSFPESDVMTLLEGAFQRGVSDVNVEGRDFALTSLDDVHKAANYARESVAGRGLRSR